MSTLVTITLVLAMLTTTTSSPKKGVCIPPGKNFFCGDLETFTSVSWWYNWATRPNHDIAGYCTCDTVLHLISISSITVLFFRLLTVDLSQYSLNLSP